MKKKSNFNLRLMVYVIHGSQLLPEDHELLDQIKSESLIEPLDVLKDEWKIIYPLCEFCKNNGKTWHKRTQKKFISSSNDSEEEKNEGSKNKKGSYEPDLGSFEPDLGSFEPDLGSFKPRLILMFV
ncbi:hypothetical protein C2G38_2241427 [Gigaspora rosea]|uniref:Uncharacterized protein n=1 Tax=Gigaspora rosea TaxID=44941 RepID=A0A397VVL3_9GLOM|nr:hypothetical protein C2G38_2241427 [Gigaspora rosea]